MCIATEENIGLKPSSSSNDDDQLVERDTKSAFWRISFDTPPAGLWNG